MGMTWELGLGKALVGILMGILCSSSILKEECFGPPKKMPCIRFRASAAPETRSIVNYGPHSVLHVYVGQC